MVSSAEIKKKLEAKRRGENTADIEELRDNYSINSKNRMCPNCSARNPENADFCMDCGTKLGHAPETGTKLDQKSEPSDEEFLAIIDLKNRRRLFVTSHSLLVAKLGPTYYPGLIVLVVVGFFFGLIGILITSITAALIAKYLVDKRKKELDGLSVDEILIHDKENFKIPYNQVRNVVTKNNGSDKEIHVFTGIQSYSLIMTLKTYNENLNMLQKVLPDITPVQS